MKKVGILLLVLLMSFTLVIGCSNQVEEDIGEEPEEGLDLDAEIADDNLIVALEDQGLAEGVSLENIQAVAQDVSNEQVDALSATGDFEVVDSLLGSSNEAEAFSPELTEGIVEKMGYVHTVSYTGESNDFEEIKAELEKVLAEQGESVRYIEPNYKYEAVGNMDRRQEWHYNMVNAPEAWETTTGSSDVSIAVLDTGIDYNHQDLANLVDRNASRDFTGEGLGDDQGHGTHVAGTVASYNNVSGVMQEATLIDVKVLGARGGGSLNDIQRGILYAADVGADVMNMSLGGGGYSQAMADAVETAHTGGTVVVAASGNDGRGSVSYPSGYEHAISVGSVDRNRNRSRFSNYGSGLDIVAPGEDIYSTYPNNSYRSLAGTSMASPHVAGVAGLIRAADGDLSADDVWDLMVDTAQDAGPENQYGAGIVDVATALAELGDIPEEPEDPEDPEDPEEPEDPEPEPEDLIVAIQSTQTRDVVSRIEERSWWSTNVYIRERGWQQAEAQMWDAKHHGDGVYSFINLASGNALDINSYDRGIVVERDYTEAEHQKWRVVDVNGSYALQNVETNYVLTGEQSSGWWSSSDRILQDSWAQADYQLWDIHVLEGQTSNIEDMSAATLSDEEEIQTKIAN